MTLPSEGMPDTQRAPNSEEGPILAGRYRLLRRLGAGGMGEVHEALHLSLNQRVALKMLHPESAAYPGAIERFHREARAAATLKSEHVARMIDAGATEQGAPYIVMELLDGVDLSQLLAARGPLPFGEVVGYVLQASEAIAEAHSLGIVHRDLKPANLFLASRLDGSPQVKVLDFGISKLSADAQQGEASQLTRTHDVVGSPSYMSPEQLRSSRDVDGRADIWSLGVILYELIAGVQPFLGTSLTQITIRVVQEEPTALRELRPDVPPALADAIHRCLAKQRDQRFGSVAELAHAIEPFAVATMMPGAAARIERASGPRLGGDTSPSRVAASGPSMPRAAASGGSTSVAWADTHPSLAPQKLPLTPNEAAALQRGPSRLPLAVLVIPVALVAFGLGAAGLFLRPTPKPQAPGAALAQSALPPDRVHLPPIASTPTETGPAEAASTTPLAATGLPSSRGQKLGRPAAVPPSTTPAKTTAPGPTAAPATTPGTTELPTDRK